MAGLRPETLSVVIDDATATPSHSVTGRVVEVVYYGDMTYYEVALDGAQKPVTISMKNLPGRRVLEIGDTAKVAWDPSALVIFAA